MPRRMPLVNVQPNSAAVFARLTPRETQVLEQIVAGSLNKEIASYRHTSERTIKAHRAHIMEKLHAHSAAELGTIAEHWAGA